MTARGLPAPAGAAWTASLGAVVVAVLAVVGPRSVAAYLLAAACVGGAAIGAARWGRPATNVRRWAFVAVVGSVLYSMRAGGYDPVLLCLPLPVVQATANDAGGLRGTLGAGACVLAASVVGGLAAPELVAVWGVLAVATLVLTEAVRRAALPSLTGGPSADGTRLGARVALTLLAVLVLTPIAALVLPSPSFGSASSGAGPGSGDASGPYLQPSDGLDLDDRPDRGDLDREVLTVRADAPSFWRGQSFDRWDGRSWSSTSETPAIDLPGDTFVYGTDVERQDAGPPAAEPVRVVQQVRVVGPYLGMVVAAPSPVRIDAPTLLRERGDGAIEVPAGLGRGASYTVVSERVPATAALLRANDPRQRRLPEGYDRYLQLPDDVDADVEALAAQLDAGSASTYDLVLAVEDWLDANTTYTLDLPPLPDGADPVAQHLFVDRRGWCEQIATSSAVLLRLAGVPARLATGFAPGTRSALSDEFRVTVGDAHAWVEVWFPGVGWQGFDPTADVPLAGEVGDRWIDRVRRNLDGLLPVLAAIAVVAGIGLAAAWLLRRASARRRRTWVQVIVRRVDAAGARRGRARSPSETPIEHAAALVAGPVPDDRLLVVAAAVSDAAYGGRAVDDDFRRWTDETLDDLERRHPAPRWWKRWGRSR